MQELKAKWEEWYGDMVDMYQWQELDYQGKAIIYVHGNCILNLDEGNFSSYFIQVIGYKDSGETIEEREQQEVFQLLKDMHGMDNITFWTASV
jgi:hypothetical protein